MPHTGVQLKLDRSGGVTVFCGETEIGQGSDSVLAACVAEVLGIEPPTSACHVADTDLTPVDLGSYSSRVTLMMGNAAIEAAERARAISSRRRCREQLGVPLTRLVVRRGVACSTPPPRNGAPPSRKRCASAEARSAPSAPPAPTPRRARRRSTGRGVGPSPTYSYSAAVVEVEVDPDTGALAPRARLDRPRHRPRINPALVVGQVEGSVYMGLGEAMMEEQAFRRLPSRLSHALVHKFPSMLEYKSPTFLEMPRSHLPDRGPRPGRPVRRQGGGARGRCCRSCRRSPTRSYDAVGVRVDQVPIHPHMGHHWRQRLPRHALHLLQPERGVAAGDLLLHEGRGADLLGGPLLAPLLGGAVVRCGADADGSRRARAAGFGERRARAPGRRPFP
jgi:4-hydroxybenzoyl-CoA reductase subunit alpha